MKSMSVDDFTAFDIFKLAKLAVEDNVEVNISISPDNLEINIQPWKPYEMKCPYNVVNSSKE